MKQLLTEININDTHLQAEYDIYQDGKYVSTVPCHSFVGNFMRYLQSAFVQDQTDAYVTLTNYPSNTCNISSISGLIAYPQYPLQINVNNTHGLYHRDKVTIAGVNGCTNANGTFYVGYNPGSFGFCIYYDDYLIKPVPMNALYTSGGSLTARQKRVEYDNTFNLNFHANAGDTTSGIILGRGTNPVSVNDSDLQTRIAHGTGTNQLSYTAVTTNIPAIDAPANTTCQFTSSRGFTNSSAADITVTEVGIVCLVYEASANNQYAMLISRDVLSSPIIIPIGKTLTLNYRIKAVPAANGGLVRGFIESLYQQNYTLAANMTDIHGTTRSVGAIYAANYRGNTAAGRSANVATTGNSTGLAPMLNLAGPVGGEMNSSTLGLVIGSGITAPTVADTTMAGWILTGSGIGQLATHGTYVEQTVVDATTNSAYLDLTKIVENRSLAPVTIKEVGYTGLAGAFVGYLMARLVLDPGDYLTLNPTEYAKIKLRLRLYA